MNARKNEKKRATGIVAATCSSARTARRAPDAEYEQREHPGEAVDADDEIEPRAGQPRPLLRTTPPSCMSGNSSAPAASATRHSPAQIDAAFRAFVGNSAAMALPMNGSAIKVSDSMVGHSSERRYVERGETQVASAR